MIAHFRVAQIIGSDSTTQALSSLRVHIGCFRSRSFSEVISLGDAKLTR